MLGGRPHAAALACMPPQESLGKGAKAFHSENIGIDSQSGKRSPQPERNPISAIDPR
jgi:hypothetical protein